jgi:predicted enzyme related to lactoylglutathione lyase
MEALCRLSYSGGPAMIPAAAAAVLDTMPSVVDVRFHEVVIDCADPRSLARFWAGFTGYDLGGEDDDWASIRSADGSVIIGFQRVPEPKTVKNRVHLDFSAVDEEATAREIEAMGATRRWVSEDPEDPFVVLADPEGNEFCIVRSA